MQVQPQSFLENLQETRTRLGRIGIYAGLGLAGMAFISTFVIKLSGAVVANGHIIPQGRNIIIQHPDGGLVKNVMVENGDRVTKTSEILRFDGSELNAELKRLEGLKLTLDLRIASSRAALKGKNTFSWHNELRYGDPAVKPISNRIQLRPGSRGRNGGYKKAYLMPISYTVYEANEIIEEEPVPELDSITRQKAALRADRALYASRLHSIKGRIHSSNRAREVLNAQLVSIRERSHLIDDEIKQLKVLVEDRLVQRSRMTALQRERLEIRQRTEALRLEDTRLQGEIALAEKELINLQNEDVNRLWTQMQTDEEELANVEYNIANIKSRLSRLAVLAPVNGRVHELSVQNPGSVVQQGAVILQIVPEGRPSEVSVQIDLASIDDVEIGKSVRLRFDTFKEHAATELQGKILQISPDRSLDPVTGLPFYAARIGLNEESIRDFQKIGPSTGAPVTVMIETKQRSMANYLFEPVRQSLSRTFSET